MKSPLRQALRGSALENGSTVIVLRASMGSRVDIVLHLSANQRLMRPFYHEILLSSLGSRLSGFVDGQPAPASGSNLRRMRCCRHVRTD